MGQGYSKEEKQAVQRIHRIIDKAIKEHDDY